MAQSRTQDREELTLNAEDIPGAVLTDPLDKHKVISLRWWLLCRGITAPGSLKGTYCQVMRNNSAVLV